MSPGRCQDGAGRGEGATQGPLPALPLQEPGSGGGARGGRGPGPGGDNTAPVSPGSGAAQTRRQRAQRHPPQNRTEHPRPPLLGAAGATAGAGLTLVNWGGKRGFAARFFVIFCHLEASPQMGPSKTPGFASEGRKGVGGARGSQPPEPAAEFGLASNSPTVFWVLQDYQRRNKTEMKLLATEQEKKKKKDAWGEKINKKSEFRDSPGELNQPRRDRCSRTGIRAGSSGAGLPRAPGPPCPSPNPPVSPPNRDFNPPRGRRHQHPPPCSYSGGVSPGRGTRGGGAGTGGGGET